MKLFLSILALLIACASCSSTSLDQRMSDADALVGVGNHAGARDIYFDVAASCPKYQRCAEALFRVAEIEVDIMKRPENALEAYARVIEFFPLKEAGRVARQRRAVLFERQGDYLGAAEEYAQLLQYFPKDEHAVYYLMRLGEAYVALGNYQQARSELASIISSTSTDGAIRAEALFAFAESYFLQGRLGLAEKSYQRLIDEFPQSTLVPEARLKIATCREERGLLGDAVKSMEEAKKTFSNKRIIDERLKSLEQRGTAKPPVALQEQNEAKEEAKKAHEAYEEKHHKNEKDK